MADEITDAEANAAFDPDRDNEPVYDTELRPLMDEVIRLCRARGIPFLAVFQLSTNRFYESVSIPIGASSLLHALDDFLDGNISLDTATPPEPN